MNLSASIPIYEHIARIEETSGCTIGVHAVSDEVGAPVVAHHAERLFAAASIMKLFVAYAICKEYAGCMDTLTVPITPLEHRPGMGVLANISAGNYPLRDVLFFLLAHSDNTAHCALERFAGTECIAHHIEHVTQHTTTYVPYSRTNGTNQSMTTPHAVTALLRRMWSGELLNPPERDIFLGALAKSSSTYFGLRNLPCALNTQQPDILAHYSKSGKLRDTIADAMILRTHKHTLYVYIVLDGYHTTMYGNSVDHGGILHLADLAVSIYHTLTHLETAQCACGSIHDQDATVGV
ncbi:MAG: serine hydrolase [Candidatus Pacebacteria bacterium]|nr:serine hydrolase [Candidatus Paceibacterota bacterium]